MDLLRGSAFRSLLGYLFTLILVIETPISYVKDS
jgi:hypothetical protein